MSEVKNQGPKLIGTNFQARGIRPSIGWKPVKTTKDFLETIETIKREVLNLLGNLKR